MDNEWFFIFGNIYIFTQNIDTNFLAQLSDLKQECIMVIYEGAIFFKKGQYQK